MYSLIHINETVPLKLDFEHTMPLWEAKQDAPALRVIEKGDPYVYKAQYLQTPSTQDGNMFKDQYWKHYEVLPRDFDMIRMYGDTAQKQGERNDYSVFEVWGRNALGIFLIDLVRGKWEAPQLESVLVEFYNKHKPNIHKPVGVSMVKIEDKSSGSSLIQTIAQNYRIPIDGIQRNRDKVLRAHGVIGQFASGNIYLPKDAPWLHDFKQEFREFNAMMTHKHDDQIDPTMDAVEDLLVNDPILYTTRNLK